MPSVSKAQQQAAAIAEHHPEKAKGAAKEMAKSMSKSQLHDFAATKRKKLPKHAEKKASFNQPVKESPMFTQAFLQGYLVKEAGLREWLGLERPPEPPPPTPKAEEEARQFVRGWWQRLANREIPALDSGNARGAVPPLEGGRDIFQAPQDLLNTSPRLQALQRAVVTQMRGKYDQEMRQRQSPSLGEKLLRLIGRPSPEPPAPPKP